MVYCTSHPKLIRWKIAMAGRGTGIETGHEAGFGASEASLNKALDELIANREREGARMRELILQRCEAIQKIVKKTRKKMPEIQQRYQQKLRTAGYAGYRSQSGQAGTGTGTPCAKDGCR